MALPMHSPESREKVYSVKVSKLERSLTPRQQAAYDRWLAACAKMGVGTGTEARYEFLRDMKDDVTLR